MEAKNIKEFKALIERYESIILKDIKENWIEGFHCGCLTAKKLTGFGSCHTCTLCLACKDTVFNKCFSCVYNNIYGCIYNNSTLKISYDRIDNSKTPRQLLNAFRNRAKVLREFAKENNINIE